MDHHIKKNMVSPSFIFLKLVFLQIFVGNFQFLPLKNKTTLHVFGKAGCKIRTIVEDL